MIFSAKFLLDFWRSEGSTKFPNRILKKGSFFKIEKSQFLNLFSRFWIFRFWILTENHHQFVQHIFSNASKRRVSGCFGTNRSPMCSAVIQNSVTVFFKACKAKILFFGLCLARFGRDLGLWEGWNTKQMRVNALSVVALVPTELPDAQEPLRTQIRACFVGWFLAKIEPINQWYSFCWEGLEVDPWRSSAIGCPWSP